MAVEKIEESLEIPEGVELKVEGDIITAKGKKGELKRKKLNPKVKVKIEGNEVIFLADKKPTKREKKSIGTLRAHVRNMIKGVNEGYLYRLKICTGHFPMNVSVSNNEFIVKNFLGEKVPRVLKLRKGVSVDIQGTEVRVVGIDKDLTSQTAASIERLTIRVNYDKRIFQDGIYIVEKDAKKGE